MLVMLHAYHAHHQHRQIVILVTLELEYMTHQHLLATAKMGINKTTL